MIITDPEFKNAGERIEAHYAGHEDRYALREVRTDPLSYRWMVDYYTLRQTSGHEDAIREVERRMKAAIGEGGPSVPLPEPARRGTVRMVGRAMADDLGAYLPVGTSLFYAVREAGEPQVRENLSWLAARGVHYPRVLCETTDWSPDLMTDPRRSDFDERVREVRDTCGDLGMRVFWTLFGGNRLTPQEQEACVDEMIDVCDERRDLVQGVEMSNEGNGFKDADGPRRMRAFAARFAARGIPTALTSAAHGDTSLYAGANLQVATEHFDRLYGEYGWRPVRQPWGYWDRANMPPAFINNEPIGIGSSVAVETDPLRLALAAATTWLVGGAAHVVHTGAGIYGVVNDHPVGGRRPANVWEQPTLEPTLAVIARLRALLPPDLPNWTRVRHGKHNHPFAFPPDPWSEDRGEGLQSVGDKALTANAGCVRAYAAYTNDQFVCLPFGIMGALSLEPVKPMSWTTYDPLTGEQRMSGNGPLALTRDALIVGRF